MKFQCNDSKRKNPWFSTYKYNVLKHYNNNNIPIWEKILHPKYKKNLYERRYEDSSIKRTKSSSRQHIATHSESKFLMKSTILHTDKIKSTFFRLVLYFFKLEHNYEILKIHKKFWMWHFFKKPIFWLDFGPST